jgi:hypothetical protein
MHYHLPLLLIKFLTLALLPCSLKFLPLFDDLHTLLCCSVLTIFKPLRHPHGPQVSIHRLPVFLLDFFVEATECKSKEPAQAYI